MFRASTLAAITLVSALSAPLVVHATGAASARPQAPAAPAAAVQAVATQPIAAPACPTRKVKVVYVGLGEGQGGTCAAAAR